MYGSKNPTWIHPRPEKLPMIQKTMADRDSSSRLLIRLMRADRKVLTTMPARIRDSLRMRPASRDRTTTAAMPPRAPPSAAPGVAHQGRQHYPGEADAPDSHFRGPVHGGGGQAQLVKEHRGHGVPTHLHAADAGGQPHGQEQGQAQGQKGPGETPHFGATALQSLRQLRGAVHWARRGVST